jgi:hypothetical protein
METIQRGLEQPRKENTETRSKENRSLAGKGEGAGKKLQLRRNTRYISNFLRVLRA